MLNVVSYGGGVQSTALLVLAAEREIDFPVFVFANTGDDSENPDTLAYIRQTARPYAEQHGVELHTIKREWRDGRDWSLLDLLMNEASRSIEIPVRMSNGSPGNRSCTIDFKIRVIAAWLKSHGATPDQPAHMALGISLDELQRARSSSGNPLYDVCYPLIDRRLDRSACVALIAGAGLPVPPKSSCWFCPFHPLTVWREMRDTRPDLFAKSVALEARLNERRAKIGKDEVWLTRKLVPLDRAIGDGVQPSLFGDEDDNCESGFCLT